MVFLCLALIFGIVIGCIGGGGMAGFIDESDMTDYTVSWYLDNKISFGSYFGQGLLDVFCCCALIIFTNWHIILVFGNYLLLIVKGYVIGFNSFLIISALGVGGLFQIVFIFLPQQLLLMAVLVYVSVYATDRCLCYRGCGLLNFRDVGYWELLKKIFIAILIFSLFNLFFALISSVAMSSLVI